MNIYGHILYIILYDYICLYIFLFLLLFFFLMSPSPLSKVIYFTFIFLQLIVFQILGAKMFPRIICLCTNTNFHEVIHDSVCEHVDS